jgi:hypothetical protein
MRLVNLTVTGFRHFEKESINLDGHLVAILQIFSIYRKTKKI